MKKLLQLLKNKGLFLNSTHDSPFKRNQNSNIIQKTLFACFCFMMLFEGNVSYGQFSEDFTDGNFTSSPIWSGNTANFSIETVSPYVSEGASTDGSYLASSATVGNITLTTPSTEVNEWKFSLGTGDFSPSTTNYFGVILMSSVAVSGNITSTSWNGYFLKIGNTSPDPIELWKKTGAGTGTKVGAFPSSPNYNGNALNAGLNIRVTRNASGVFELFYSTGFTYAATPTNSAGTLTDTSVTTSSYFGIYSVFANPSTSRRMFFDNIVVGTPPVVPTVTTTSNAGLIDTTNAYLTGTINANGITTNASFDYGATVSYGSTATASPSSVSGTTTTSIDAYLGSLSINTQYHYRAVGTVSAVPTNGADMTFYTLAATPGVLLVDNTTQTTVDVTVNSTTQNANPAVTEFAIKEAGGQYVQANGTLGATAVWQTAATWGTSTVTGLATSTTYNFSAKARNGANVETVFGTAVGGTTLAEQLVDYNRIQYPNAEQTLTVGVSLDVYTRAYEPGLTTNSGAQASLKGWVGYSSTNDNPGNAGWTWVAATFNAEDGNDDEYKATLSGLPIGTYYYAGRFQIGTGPYVYGGTGGNWNSDSVKLNVNPDVVDYANVFTTGSTTITQGETKTIYAQVFELGITEAAGQGTGITAEIGYSTTNGSPDDSWTWLTPTFNVQSGNNDEYKLDLGTGFAPGTYYIASRFIKSGSSVYVYGGTGGIYNNDSAVLTILADVVDFANIQYPATGAITEGMTFDIYAQVYEAGVTNGAGQAAGITAQIGYSTTNGTPDDNWTWVSASYHADGVGDNANNDEYKATFSGLTPGTYYYASRFIKTGSTFYVYAGTAGVWNNDSGVLTVNALGTPVATNATAVGSTSFTANWGAVTNATGYELDVYTMELGASPELVANGGFETGNVSSWTFESAMNQVASTVQTHTGTYSMYSTVSATKNFKQAISVVSGEEYTLGFWYYIDGSSAGNGFRVWTTTGATVQLPSTTGYFNTKGSWQYVEELFTPSSNSMELNFRLYNGVKLYLDDISVKLNASSPVATPITGSPFTISAPTTSYNVTGVDPETTYSYVVRAILGSNTSANSDEISVATTASIITWNGLAWSNSTGPDLTKDAVINGDYNVAANITAKNLTINTGFTVTVWPTNALEVSGNLVNNGSIIFESTEAGTARFAAYTGAAISGTGTTTVERYIPAKRAWRLLTAPLKGAENNSIFANWQNDGAAAVGSTGILLWHPTGTATPTSSNNGLFNGPQPNIYSYGTTWSPVTNTNASNLFTSTENKAYLVFSTGPHATANVGVTTVEATTARATGSLITGAVDHSIAADQFKLIPNPYASPIDTEALVADNAPALVSLLDPSSDLGAYITYDGSNWSSPISNTNDKLIQSGQSFFVKSTSDQTFTITEAHKTDGNSNNWFEKTTTSADKIRVLLYKQMDANWTRIDGILSVNKAGGNNAVDTIDVTKMTNFSEIMMFKNGASNLAIEYRNLPQVGDIQPLQLTATTAIPYQFKVYVENYSNSTLQPYLEDAQAGTLTAIPMDGSEVIIPFTGVVSTNASPDNRFKIVYQTTLSTSNPTLVNVSVYPNPVVNNQFNINLGTNNNNANYTITNLLGQSIQKGDLPSTQNTISIPAIVKGIYILNVSQEDKLFTTKIYVQ